MKFSQQKLPNLLNNDFCLSFPCNVICKFKKKPWNLIVCFVFLCHSHWPRKKMRLSAKDSAIWEYIAPLRTNHIARITNGSKMDVVKSVIILAINKSDSRCAVVRFCYHSYDYRLNWTPLSPIAITNWTPLIVYNIARAIVVLSNSYWAS